MTGCRQRVRPRRVDRFERRIVDLGSCRSRGFVELVGQAGFPRSTPGNHISARAQESILGEATNLDARCALLEAVFVLVTVNVARAMTGSAEVPRQLGCATSTHPRPTISPV